MNLERLRWGEWIAGIAGLDLLLVTFRSWYKVTGTGAHVTAWDALHTGRYLLLATAVVGIFLLLIQASEDAARMSLPPGWAAAAVGFACTVYVGYRLASPPSDTLDPDVGIYFGLAGALGVTIGGLLSAREAPALAGAPLSDERSAETEPLPETIGGLVPDTGTNTWSPAAPAPAPSTSGWSPASTATAAAVPPATAAGAGLAEEERPLRPGDQVTLTAGGARFPAGTVADVVEVFGGGALVEVKAPDGVAERFEVPDSAFERGISVPTGSATSGESWSPALPAAAGAGATAADDWGFDEPGGGAATATEPVGADAPDEKVPWWKREIGGGKKKKKAELAAAAGAGAAAAAAIATTNGEADTGAEEKPSFFKRLFGGGAKQEAATEETAEVAPHEPDAAAEPEAAEPAPAGTEAEVPGPEPEPEPEPQPEEPEPEPVASEPEAAAAAASEPEPASDPEPEASASAAAASAAAASADADAPAEAEPAPPTSAPEPAAAASTPGVTSEPEPEAAASPAAPGSEPEPEAAASPAAPGSEPEPTASAVEAPSAPDPETAASPSEGAVPASEPVAPASPDPDPVGPESAAAGAGAGAAAAEEGKPKRRRSSGSRKVPKEAVAAAASEDGPPKVGDEVQLKVSGGKFDAGTRGTVVDVFSAGVIVELSDNTGNTERLDLPFEAVGPAEA